MNSTKPRLAVCLYGQPRSYITGFNNLCNYLNPFKKIYEIDFFYHTYYDETFIGKKYNSSPWRKIKNNVVKQHVLKNLKKIYKPVAYSHNTPILFKNNQYVNLRAYQNSNNKTINNLNNLLSQLYSRKKVKNIFEEYILKTNTNYNLVISCRFDFLKPITLDLTHIDNEVGRTHIYVSNIRQSNILLPDNFIVLNPVNFLKIFNMYNDLSIICDSDMIEKELKKNNIQYILNMEEILLAQVYYHSLKEKVIYTKDIPDFRYY